jgi:hypothetical protein
VPLREIVEEDSYRDALRKLGISAPALDRAFQDLSFSLAAKPEIFPESPGTGYRRVRVNGFGHIPNLDIWFMCSAEKVSLKMVEVFSEEE